MTAQFSRKKFLDNNEISGVLIANNSSHLQSACLCVSRTAIKQHVQ